MEIKCVVFAAVAKQLGLGLQHPRALELYFGNTESRSLVPAVDIQQIEAIAKIVCSALIPLCTDIEQLP